MNPLSRINVREAEAVHFKQWGARSPLVCGPVVVSTIESRRRQVLM